MSFGKPIKPAVVSETLRQEFEREVPATDNQFKISRYQGMRVLNTETNQYEYMPRGTISYSDFVNKQYFFEPYPVPIAVITTQPSSLSVYQNTGTKEFRVDAQYGFQTSAYPKYRPTPKEYGSITWEKSIDDGASWVEVTTGIKTDTKSDTPNYSILTVSSDPGISGALFRARVTATLRAEDDQDLNDPTPPVITVGSSQQLTDVVSITTKEAAVSNISDEFAITEQLESQSTTILFSNTGQILRNGKAKFSFNWDNIYPTQHFSREVTAESTTVVFEASYDLGATWFEIDSANSLSVGVLSFESDRTGFTISDIDSTTLTDTVFRAHITMSQSVTNPTATLTKTLTTNVATLRVLESREQLPEYTMTPDDVTMAEGGIATFTVTTQRHRTGTMYWGISSGSADFEDATGSFSAQFNGESTFEIEASEDLITEENETFLVKVYTDSARTNMVVSSRVVLLDTTPVYGISPADEVITEGDKITFRISGTNTAYSTLNYEITEVEDFAKFKARRQTDEKGNTQFTIASKYGTVPDNGSKDYTVTVKEGTRVVAQTTLTVEDFPDKYANIEFGGARDDSGTVYFTNSGYPDYEDVLDSSVTLNPGLTDWDAAGNNESGYYVGANKATVLEETYQWEYLTPDGTTGDWTGAQDNKGVTVVATDTYYNGWQFRMRVYAKVESVDGDITELTQYSRYAKVTVNRKDQPAPVSRLIDFTVRDTYTEGDDVYFDIETDNLDGATANITCDNGPLNGLDKDIVIKKNKQGFFIRTVESNFLSGESSTVECAIEGIGTLSVDVTLDNDSGTIGAAISPSSIDEGESVRITATGTNLSDTEVQWSVTAPTGLVGSTSGTFDLAFIGNTSNGKYSGSVDISTNELTTDYRDKTMTVTATHAGNTLATQDITVKNINIKPPPVIILPPAITAFSISPVSIVNTEQTGSGKSTATVTGGTAPYTYEWSYITDSADSYTSASVSANGSYCTVSASSGNTNDQTSLSGTLSCTVTDARGLTQSATASVSATIGEEYVPPPPQPPPNTYGGQVTIVTPVTPPYTPPPELTLTISSISDSAKVKYKSGLKSSAADGSEATAAGGVPPYKYSWSYKSTSTSDYLTTGGVYVDNNIGVMSTSSSKTLTDELPDTTVTDKGTISCTVTDAAGTKTSASSTYKLSISVFGTVPADDPPPKDPPKKVVDTTVPERTGRGGNTKFSMR